MEKKCIAEMDVTALDMSEIRVTVALPTDNRTVSSCMQLSFDDIECLRYLSIPEYIKAHGTAEDVHMWVLQNRHKQDQAREVLKIITSKLALHLSHCITKELGE